MNYKDVIDYIEKWKTDYSVDAKDRMILSKVIRALKRIDKIDEELENAYECGYGNGYTDALLDISERSE